MKPDERRCDLHGLDDNGMIACNPRDKEAAHRAQMEGIATNDPYTINCKKCLVALRSRRR